MRDWTERMSVIQDIVHQLPSENFETLRFLCQHLKRVSSFEASNKMTVKNLSIIFGPTVLR
ncbi:Rho GTPase-activating protein domain-containing protein, partial [Chytriomyces sp. MP71]